MRALGVANTLWLDNDALHADNSDVTGFVAHLDDSLPDWNEKTKHVVILGAGGAARAVIYGLKSRGVENITIVNRTPDRAAQLTKEINIAADIAAFDKLPALLAQTDLLVNTTSLGMKGQPSLEIDLRESKSRRSGLRCCLCTAGNRTSETSRANAAIRRSTVSACSCIRRWWALSAGSA